MKEFKSPYLRYIPTPSRGMKGKGAPKATIFGVMGHTKEDPYTRSLGGLIRTTTKGAPVPPHKSVAHAPVTEKGAISHHAPATHIPGAHYAQVPYAGAYMSKKGAEVS